MEVENDFICIAQTRSKENRFFNICIIKNKLRPKSKSK